MLPNLHLSALHSRCSCAQPEDESDAAYFSLREAWPRVAAAPKWLTSLMFFSEDILNRMKNHKDFSVPPDTHVHRTLSETECHLHLVNPVRRRNLAFVGPRRDFTSLIGPLAANLMLLMEGWRTQQRHMQKVTWIQMANKLKDAEVSTRY